MTRIQINKTIHQYITNRDKTDKDTDQYCHPPPPQPLMRQDNDRTLIANMLFLRAAASNPCKRSRTSRTHRCKACLF
jgi:hypothetical protein